MAECDDSDKGPALEADVPDASPASPFDIVGENLGTALVFASPHSGRHYPSDLMDAAVIGVPAIRRSEDPLVDSLLCGASKCGVPLLRATYARAYIDVNRGAYELDQAMFEDELPSYAVRSARVVAGLGSIARVVAEGQEIYRGKLLYSRAKDRIDRVHHPYHEALKSLLAEARGRAGVAVLVDWHSMPSASAGQGAIPGPEIVLGDRFGSSCDPLVTDVVEAAFARRGYAVARNAPFAGGYTTEAYGRPVDGIHALQIELSRGLYVDEHTLNPTAGFRPLQRDLEEIIAEMAGVDWPALIAQRLPGRPQNNRMF